MIDNDTLGALRRMRDAGRSQQEVGEFLGLTRDVVRYWDNPERRERVLKRNKAYRDTPTNRAVEQERSVKRSAKAKVDRDFTPMRTKAVPEGYDEYVWTWALQVLGTSKSREDISTTWVYHKLHKGVCEATGIALQLSKGPFQPSLDRVIPGVAYSESSCQVVTLAYNFMKNSFSEGQAQDWLTKVRGG